MKITDDYEVEQHPNIVTLFPENFDKIIKNLFTDVLVMFYSNKSEKIFKPFSNLAEKYKNAEGVIFATFDRSSFTIPGLTQDQMASIEKITKG